MEKQELKEKVELQLEIEVNKLFGYAQELVGAITGDISPMQTVNVSEKMIMNEKLFQAGHAVVQTKGVFDESDVVAFMDLIIKFQKVLSK